MILKILEIVAIFLATLVTGVFFGPWLALSRSFATFEPDVFLICVRRMSKNIEPVMSILMPITIQILIVVVFFERHHHLRALLWAAALALYGIALLVTVAIEVPIVKRLEACTPQTLPADWTRMRDRWGSFHLVRIAASMLALLALLTTAIY